MSSGTMSNISGFDQAVFKQVDYIKPVVEMQALEPQKLDVNVRITSDKIELPQPVVNNLFKPEIKVEHERILIPPAEVVVNVQPAAVTLSIPWKDILVCIFASNLITGLTVYAISFATR